ncbi:MAG: hypothetical protein K0S32_2156 [Bacteroidetes bacterium]|jgi:hypothetical protein|nr:hypothetical protein [Bacteroidota bacterium]
MPELMLRMEDVKCKMDNGVKVYIFHGPANVK